MDHGTCFLRIAFLALVSVATTPAQRTWIVDAANGPGTNFTDVPPALAVAVHGDTILVRKGIYKAGTTSQGINILGVDGALFNTASSGSFRLTGLPAGQTFVMKRIANSYSSVPGPAAPALLALSNNAGRIHLERLTHTSPTSPLSPFPAITMDQCQAVSVTDCSLAGGPALACSASRLSICSSILLGSNACPNGFKTGANSSFPALRATNGSTVTVARSALQGGNGFESIYGLWPCSPAATFSFGEAVLAGDAASNCVAGYGPRPTTTASAVYADAVDLIIDPTLTLVPQGAIPAVGGIPKSLSWLRVAALKASGAPPGMAVTADLFSEAGHLGVLLAGPPGDPLTLGLGRLWLKPGSSVVIDVGYQGPSQHRTVVIPIPQDPALRGVPVALQAVSGDARTFALTLSTPSVVVLD